MFICDQYIETITREIIIIDNWLQRIVSSQLSN